MKFIGNFGDPKYNQITNNFHNKISIACVQKSVDERDYFHNHIYIARRYINYPFDTLTIHELKKYSKLSSGSAFVYRALNNWQPEVVLRQDVKNNAKITL